MSTTRKDALRDSLQEQLEVFATRESAGPIARLHWLSEQLDNYVERWRGFHAVQPAPRTSPSNDDLFVVIEVAAEMMTGEIHRLSPTVEAVTRWQRFLHVLSRIRAGSSQHAAQDLRSSFDEVLASLPGR